MHPEYLRVYNWKLETGITSNKSKCGNWTLPPKGDGGQHDNRGIPSTEQMKCAIKECGQLGPKMVKLVDELCGLAGTSKPISYMAVECGCGDPECSNHSTAGVQTCPGISRTAWAIGVGKGMLRQFSKEWIQGCVAHELGHIKHGDAWMDPEKMTTEEVWRREFAADAHAVDLGFGKPLAESFEWWLKTSGYDRDDFMHPSLSRRLAKIWQRIASRRYSAEELTGNTLKHAA